MRQATVDLYQFDELSDKAKEKARAWYRDGQEYDFDYVLEDTARVAAILGFELRTHTVILHSGKTRQDPNIWYSVSYCQGDYAAFDALYYHSKSVSRKIRKYAPTDETLHAIADKLAAVQKANRYKLVYDIKYDRRSGDIEDLWGGSSPEAYGQVREAVRMFNTWIYEQLRAEADYQGSEEYIDENIRANEYEFTIDGKREVLK